jgi:hypothetical protein
MDSMLTIVVTTYCPIRCQSFMASQKAHYNALAQTFSQPNPMCS